MTEPREKRRLGLLAEVLPAPTKPAESGPRGRTLAHLQKLLLLASTSALLDGCIPGYGVVDPLPMPSCSPPFDATTEVTITDGLVTLVITAKNASTLRAEKLFVKEGSQRSDVKLVSDKLEGNQRTVTFYRGTGTSWVVFLRASCSGKQAMIIMNFTLSPDKTKANVESIVSYQVHGL